MRGKWTVLYDGYCKLCSWAVQWILRNDRDGRFRLVPLQDHGEAGIPGLISALRKRSSNDPETVTKGRNSGDPETLTRGRSSGDPETVVLLRDGRIYSRSTAVLLIASRLRFPWPLIAALMVIPRFLRDPVYDLFARNRKRWFGERATCYLPPKGPGF